MLFPCSYYMKVLNLGKRATPPLLAVMEWPERLFFFFHDREGFDCWTRFSETGIVSCIHNASCASCDILRNTWLTLFLKYLTIILWCLFFTLLYPYCSERNKLILDCVIDATSSGPFSPRKNGEIHSQINSESRISLL